MATSMASPSLSKRMLPGWLRRHTTMTRALRSRAAAATTLLATLVLLCAEHARAFAVTAREAAILASAGTKLVAGGGVTRLRAWSVPAVPLPSLPPLPTSADLPLHTLGSWYSVADPTTAPPMYDE